MLLPKGNIQEVSVPQAVGGKQCASWAAVLFLLVWKGRLLESKSGALKGKTANKWLHSHMKQLAGVQISFPSGVGMAVLPLFINPCTVTPLEIEVLVKKTHNNSLYRYIKQINRKFLVPPQSWIRQPCTL